MTLTEEEHKIAGFIRSRLDRPLSLVGMMGAGKTRLGRMLADVLRLDFVDTDEEVEEAAGMTIAEIFEKFGEPYFRDGEVRVIQRLLEDSSVRVIATGGGAVMRAETATLLAGRTLSLWVKADLETMVARVGRSSRRPLLKTGDPEVILKQLAAVRYPLYEKADIMIESGNGTAEENLKAALVKIQDHINRTSGA